MVPVRDVTDVLEDECHEEVTIDPHADATIEAGLLIRELRAREVARRVLILAPSGLVGQWQQELKTKFAYIFRPGPVEGGGIPQLILNRFESSLSSFNVQGVEVTPISLQHGSKECIGYRFDRVAYVTDCSYIPPTSLDRLEGLSVLVLDCLRLAPHNTHFNLDQALEIISKVRPKQTYLTHLGHDFDYEEWTRKLPEGVSLAYDGLKININ